MWNVNNSKTSLDEIKEKAEETKKILKEQEALKEKEDSLAPLFLFLTSSLNVELVYVILYGISQFSLLNLINVGNEGLSKE